MPGSSTRSVLVVDDNPAVRIALAVALDAEPGLEVAGVAGDGQTAIYLAEDARPDLVVLDHQMPRVTGFAALPELRRLLPDARIVVWSSAAHLREQTYLAGGDAFLAKSESMEDLLDWLRQA